MSKNLTRKGLALGAVIALGSTLFAGTPANAAAALSIAPASGTTWNVLSSDAFKIKATGNVDLAEAQNAKLRWEVTNSAAATLTYTVSDSQASPADLTENVDGTNGATSSGTSDIVKAATSNTTVGEYNTLSINPTTDATTPSVTVAVRAFIDVDLSGTVTDGDIVSGSQTINFKTGVTGTVELSGIAAGDTPVATVTLSGDINYAQTTVTNLGVSFYKNDADMTGASQFDDSQTRALNTAKTAITVTGGEAVTAGHTIGAKAYVAKYDHSGLTTTNATAGTATYTSAAAAGTATGVALTLDNGANIRTATGSYDINSGSSASATADVAANKVVRKGTKSVSFKVAFGKTNADTNVGAGQQVKVVVSEEYNTARTSSSAAYDLPAGSEITSGGKTLKNASAGGAAETVTYYTTTDATGAVTITVDSKVAEAGEGVFVQVSSGASFGVDAVVHLLWKAAAADRLVETTERLGLDTRRITKGGTVSVAYELKDTFGQPYAAADTEYRVVVADDAGVDTNINQVVALSGGKGSVTLTDNSSAATTYNLAASLESRTTSTWAALSVANIWTTAAAGNGTESTAVAVVSALDVAATAAITAPVLASSSAIDTTNGVPLADKALAAGDSRFDLSSKTTVPAYSTSNGVRIAGKITTATGANAVGVPVVISAAGIGFKTGSVSTLGSITVYTDSSGDYTVDGYSKTSGAVVFTVTSGAAVKTQSVTFAKAAEIDAASVTVTAVKTTKTGRAIDVTVTVLDAAGNGIDTDAAAAGGITDTLDITVTGAGYTYSVPTSTNSKGQASFKLVYLGDDAGITSITASFDADGAGSTYAAKTGTAQVLAGVTASVSAGKKLATSVVKNAKGATVKVVSGSKSVTKVATSDSYKVSLTKLTAGKKTVKVYVNDVLVSSKSVTIKK